MKQTQAAAIPEDDFLALKKRGRDLLQYGEFKQAQDTLLEALKLEGDAADIFYLLGRCAHALDDPHKAVDYYNRSIKLSESADTFNALIDVYIVWRQYNEVLRLCDVAEKKNIANYDTKVRKGTAYLAMHDTVNGLMTMMKAAESQPQNPDARVLITGGVRVGVPNYNENFKMAVLACLQSDDMEHSSLAAAWMQQIREDPKAKPVIDMVGCTDYDSFAAIYAQPQNRHFVLTPYFRLGIEKLVIPEPNFEALLANLRRFYLETVFTGDELSSEEKTFVCSLALYCFLTEFCMEETPEETAVLDQMRAQIESTRDYIHPDDVAVFAAYRSLTSLSNAAELAKPGELRRRDTGRLIKMHIDEPAEEREIKKTIQHLVPIEDKISRAVQGQYEVHPYPRWTHCNRFAPIFDRYKQNMRVKMLIAGCGTGKQVVQMASILPRSEILAVDLSSSSLAYGMRKVKEYNIENVMFRQGDILNLGTALEPDSFDRVECTGVLHHMDDPMAGWRVLTKLLKPGGSMTIGLYSEFSRRGIVEARKLIAEKGFPSTLEGIRTCRAYMKTVPADTALAGITRWRDFYMVSDCRDLIFHVQEHRFTLAQIDACLKELGLEFGGFMGLSQRQVDSFMKEYPAEKTLNDLQKWHALEEKNKDLFFSIYQFICRKPLK